MKAQEMRELRRIEQLLEAVIEGADRHQHRIFEQFRRQEKLIVATKEQFKAELDGLKQDIADELKAISDKLDALSNAGGATPADLDALQAEVDEMRGTVQGETAALGATGATGPAGGTGASGASGDISATTA